jgi:hypothetical protein
LISRHRYLNVFTPKAEPLASPGFHCSIHLYTVALWHILSKQKRRQLVNVAQVQLDLEYSHCYT